MVKYLTGLTCDTYSSSKESDSVTVSGRKRKDDTQTTVSGRKRKDDTQTTGQKSKKRKVDAIKLEPNPLDMTSIHPESYHVADRLVWVEFPIYNKLYYIKDMCMCVKHIMLLSVFW